MYFQVSSYQMISLDTIKEEYEESNLIEEESSSNTPEVINIVISFSVGKLKTTTFGNVKFGEFAKKICELAGWQMKKTRFLLDGDRLQDDLTLSENEVQNHAVIDTFQEMFAGKGPNEDDILRMLEECDSDPDDENVSDNSDVSTDNLDVHYKWYEEMKAKLKDGRLELSRYSDQDQKLRLLLETDSLHPYEMLRLRNVYSLWRNLKNPIESETPETSKETNRKRANEDSSNESERSIYGATPNKRQKILKTFGLHSPSPLIKKSHITEIEMKAISVSIHLWCDKKMGGIKFLQNNRLNDSHFEDILNFTGPESKWKLIKARTVPQLRSLWRNTFGGKHYYRGHHKTGFENAFKRHNLSDCPFRHCDSGIMSQIDVDLIVLTPESSKPVVHERGKTLLSRKLFEDNLENVNTDENEEEISNQENVNTDEKEPEGLSRKLFEDNLENVNTDENEEEISNKENVNTDEKESEGLAVTLSEEIKEVPDPNVNVVGEDLDLYLNKEVKTLKETQKPNYICKIDSCGKAFQTFFGFERHIAKEHSEKKLDKEESKCQICNKSYVYLDQHMRAKHSDLQTPINCEICLKDIKSNVLKHRKICIKCRYCDYKNQKKARLLNHINKCQNAVQDTVYECSNEEPLDLRSPLKEAFEKGDKNQYNEEESKGLKRHVLVKEGTCKQTDIDEEVNSTEDSTKMEEIIDKDTRKNPDKTDDEKEALEKGRAQYPFDQESDDEDYYSELDVDDDEMCTIERRKNKDELELKLRTVDALRNDEIEGDTILVEKFSRFMRNKRQKDSKGEGFLKQTEATTIDMYSKVVGEDILKAFHKLVSPFDARWLIDCKTPKLCKFEGEERLHVAPEEPIYLTSRILQEALENTRTQKKRVISAFNQLMDFIELHFTLKLNAFGVEVLNKIITYHTGVKSYIKATSQWKRCKDEENEAYEKNKLIKDYQNPNKNVEVLERYKKYVKSEERISKIRKLFSYAYPDAKPPTAAGMTELGITVMEEIVCCTGCRPKVVRHLTMGAFVDAKPGFNPYNIKDEDATIEEEFDGDKIMRRVNPNLPPDGKACIHQKEEKSARCSENCENQCLPEGHNIWVTWDKTQSTKGPYYLHIPTTTKFLMDRYDIVRSNFFKEKKPKFDVEESWLEDEKTPFFLNSVCNSFPSLDLKNLSRILGIDVTAYDFRKIVSTWALSHLSQEIRLAEEEALQHSLHVAKERYMLNKQVQPQTLVQTYTQEENLFPEKFREEIQKEKGDVDSIITEK